MMRPVLALVGAVCLCAASLEAQDVGTAGGKGTIERLVPTGKPNEPPKSEQVAFSPRFAFAYGEGKGAAHSTWIVLTEKEPPVKSWATAKDRAEARRLWCEKEKTSFVALKLDAKWAVDLYFLCPANGGINTEMLSSWNGLESVQVKFEAKDDKHLKGTLRTGKNNCPDKNGKDAYCTPTGDFTFDAPMTK
jgi:hypothetical protein